MRLMGSAMDGAADLPRWALPDERMLASTFSEPVVLACLQQH
jgi:hypothetical protein